jgi:hypothetical protein
METHIFFWLRFVRQCPIVMFERSPRAGICGDPDVLGITQSRYLIEFECKRSMSDFRANAGKCCMIRRTGGFKPELWPRQYYFCVTENMVEKCKDELPNFAGLVSCGTRGGLWFHVNAPVHKESRRLSLKECATLSKQMASQYYNTYIKTLSGEEVDYGIEYRI